MWGHDGLGRRTASPGRRARNPFRCWQIDRDGWECPHFQDRLHAEVETGDFYQETGRLDGPISQCDQACIQITCRCGGFTFENPDSATHFLEAARIADDLHECDLELNAAGQIPCEQVCYPGLTCLHPLWEPVPGETVAGRTLWQCHECHQREIFPWKTNPDTTTAASRSRGDRP